jgi:hypothetical protein
MPDLSPKSFADQAGPNAEKAKSWRRQSRSPAKSAFRFVVYLESTLGNADSNGTI